MKKIRIPRPGRTRSFGEKFSKDARPFGDGGTLRSLRDGFPPPVSVRMSANLPIEEAHYYFF